MTFGGPAANMPSLRHRRAFGEQPAGAGAWLFRLGCSCSALSAWWGLAAPVAGFARRDCCVTAVNGRTGAAARFLEFLARSGSVVLCSCGSCASKGRACTSGRIARLPGHAGGVAGYLLGRRASAAARLCRIRACSGSHGAARAVGMAFRFSWLNGWMAVGLDRALRERASRMAQREGRWASSDWRQANRSSWSVKKLHEERPADRHRAPVVEVPKSARVVKENARSRSSPNWPTTNCPRSTCSTRRPGRMETVSADTLEMTAPDREEAQAFRRRGASGGRLAR